MSAVSVGRLVSGEVTEEQVHRLWGGYGQEGRRSHKTVTATPGLKGPDAL